jgi:hypothetical protein
LGRYSSYGKFAYSSTLQYKIRNNPVERDDNLQISRIQIFRLKQSAILVFKCLRLNLTFEQRQGIQNYGHQLPGQAHLNVGVQG